MDNTPHFHYLPPGPNPVAPLPPGESRWEMLRRWEVKKLDAIKFRGVPAGSAEHCKTVERSWWMEKAQKLVSRWLSVYVCVCVCYHLHHV